MSQYVFLQENEHIFNSSLFVCVFLLFFVCVFFFGGGGHHCMYAVDAFFVILSMSF